jgi:hypothetical protein
VTFLTEQIVWCPCPAHTTKPTTEVSTIAPVAMVTVVVTASGMIVTHVLVEVAHIFGTYVAKHYV